MKVLQLNKDEYACPACSGQGKQKTTASEWPIERILSVIFLVLGLLLAATSIFAHDYVMSLLSFIFFYASYKEAIEFRELKNL